jgi:hypothetical protein
MATIAIWRAGNWRKISIANQEREYRCQVQSVRLYGGDRRALDLEVLQIVSLREAILVFNQKTVTDLPTSLHLGVDIGDMQQSYPKTHVGNSV